MNKIKAILTTKRQIPVIIISLSVILFLGAYYYFSFEVKTIRSQAYNSLKSIATLKISQITGWNNERLADAKVFSQNSFFVGNFKNLLDSKSNVSLKSDIIKNFTLINANSDYSNVVISNTEGKILLASDSKLRQIDPAITRIVQIAVREKKIISTDLYRSSLNNEIYLDYIAPIIDKNNVVIAVLILCVDPESYLYPLIKEWPVPSKTSETLIVRRENGIVLYLNELNHQPGATLKFMIPLTRKEVPAVQAVLGHKGFFEGVSYHGTHVLSYISPVSGTPWIMVAQQDDNEIYAELYFKEIVTISFTVFLILVLSGGLVWSYDYRQKNIYRDLFFKEKELQEYHKKFRTILYSIGDGVITIDKNGNIQEMNQTAEKLTGWNEAEAKNKPLREVFKIINEKTRSIVENPFQRAMSEGIIVGLANHTLLISKNGDEIPIADSGAPIKSELGEILGVVLIFRDQIEERNAQKAIEESEQRFKAVYNGSPSAISISEIETGNLIEINEAYEKLFGYDKDEIIGKSSFELGIWINKDDRKIIIDAIIYKGSYNNLEINLKTKNGSFIRCLLSGRIILIKNKRFMITILHDITELRKAGLAVKESEERFRKIFIEHSAVKLLIEPETGKIVEANKAASEYYGWTNEELLQMDINEINILSPHETKIEMEKARRRLKNRFEFRHRLKNGVIRDVEVFSSKVDIDGKEYLHSIIHDITDRKLAQERLIKEKDLLQALLDNIPDTIYFKDRNSKFTRVNKAQAKVLGISGPEEAIGKSDFDFFEKEHASKAYEDEQKIIESRIPLIAESTLKR